MPQARLSIDTSTIPYGAITTLNPDFTTDPNPSGNVYIAYYFQGLRFDGNSGRTTPATATTTRRRGRG